MTELPKKSNLVLDHRYFNGDFKDSSGNNNHGVPSGVHFEKHPDKHAKFSGTDVITVADSSELQLTEGTIIAYGDFDDISGTPILVSKMDAAGVNYEFYQNNTGLAWWDGVSGCTFNVPFKGSKSMTCSFINGSKPKVYLDGAFAIDGSAAVVVTVDDAPVKIGNRYNNAAVNPNPLKGVLIYNTVLTDEEIAQAHAWIMETKTAKYPKRNFVYPSQINPKATGLVAGYDMKVSP